MKDQNNVISELKENLKARKLTADEYFASIREANTLEALGEEPEEFDIWCYWKFKEISIKTKTSRDLEVNPDPGRVSERLQTYAPDLSWAISQHQLIMKSLKDTKDARQHWYNEKHLVALRALKAQGNSAPALKSIEAYIEQSFNDEWLAWETELDNLVFKQNSLEKHLTLWMKLDKVLGNLLYEMNTEFWRNYKQQPSASVPETISREMLNENEENEFKQFLKKVNK